MKRSQWLSWRPAAWTFPTDYKHLASRITAGGSPGFGQGVTRLSEARAAQRIENEATGWRSLA